MFKIRICQSSNACSYFCVYVYLFEVTWIFNMGKSYQSEISLAQIRHFWQFLGWPNVPKYLFSVESTYFLLKFSFLMKSYPTDSIFSPIAWCFDVAQGFFFSAILEKNILLQKSTAPKFTSKISKKLTENVFKLI